MERTESEEYKRAKKRVEDVKGFYIHLVTYLIINGGLFLLNFATSRDSWWFYWPLLGWGIGIVFHALSVFVTEGSIGRHWEERKIRELMERDREMLQSPS
jgi:hypothetical protein